MTSFEPFVNIKFNIFHLFLHYLIFYLLKMIQYDKIQHLHITDKLCCFKLLRNGTT